MPDLITSAMFAGKPAWHRKGNVLREAPNSVIARKMAGLEWEPETVSLRTSDGDLIGSHVAVRRDDTKDVLGVVGEGWKPVLNGQLFEYLDSLVGTGEARYESAGCIQNGKRVWGLLRIPGTVEVSEGDNLERYILAANGHDGSLAFSTCATSVRVVCQNTLSYALRKGAGSVMKVYHRSGVEKQLEKARDVLSQACRRFEKQTDESRLLASIDVTTTQARNYFADVLDRVILKSQQDQEEIAQESLPQVGGPGLLDLVVSQYDNGAKASNPSRHKELLSDILNRFERETAVGTAWGAYNAVSEWVDHGRNYRSADSRFTGTLLGTGNREKQQAFTMALNTFSS